MKKSILTLMCGLPRSGKSTWIEKNKKKTDVIVSPDEIREDLFGHSFHKPAEPMIWSLTEFFIKSLIKQKLDIILDACNLTTFRNRWIDLAIENKYNVNIVVLDTPLKTCIKRNQNKIPLDVLKNMSRFFNLDFLQQETKMFNKITIVR